jgi:hypothetical protein
MHDKALLQVFSPLVGEMAGGPDGVDFQTIIAGIVLE